MRISMIACMAADRVIGKDNQMPWHLPADLKHFKAVTMGKPVVMGRRTYESIGRPLPGRHNVVISRRPDYRPEGVSVVTSIEAALALLESEEELMIIGGGQLYSSLMARADRLYLTLAQMQVEGDTRFPDYNSEAWQEVERQIHPADERNCCDLHFVTLERIVSDV
ncbi:type 3 dihydrofolate reductase [Ferrimonas sp. SCSIO 43195]|uniref:type 3 dihydrofolate reductase n=1 Tax=Ferrimonas sp. SCSIO 43195 TaxID=2822844 RepID=UPI0020765082|nr:type 3 dihydrofolate reductase [Ferrimonas sp. SCSIO 43195]USD39643.1 type 3 dihydrofolate reductase [Ferrimonas sp. SCSIO 43195]